MERITFGKIGFAKISRNTLDMIYIRPGQRRKGYANKLLTYCLTKQPNLKGIAGSVEGEKLLKKFNIEKEL